MEKIRAKGGVIVNELKIGDVIYECEYGECIKSTVITNPKQNDKGQWEWDSKTASGEVIGYLITPGFAHYGPALYYNLEKH